MCSLLEEMGGLEIHDWAGSKVLNFTCCANLCTARKSKYITEYQLPYSKYLFLYIYIYTPTLVRESDKGL